jgi:autophagy-related protein 5
MVGLRARKGREGGSLMFQDDFDSYSRFASRILPLPTLPAPTPGPSSQNSTRPGSTDPASGAGGPKADSAYTVRALPVKIYLPDNAPVIHEMIPPLGTDGQSPFYLT